MRWLNVFAVKAEWFSVISFQFVPITQLRRWYRGYLLKAANNRRYGGQKVRLGC